MHPEEECDYKSAPTCSWSAGPSFKGEVSMDPVAYYSTVAFKAPLKFGGLVLGKGHDLFNVKPQPGDRPDSPYPAGDLAQFSSYW